MDQTRERTERHTRACVGARRACRGGHRVVVALTKASLGVNGAVETLVEVRIFDVDDALAYEPQPRITRVSLVRFDRAVELSRLCEGAGCRGHRLGIQEFLLTSGLS